MSTTSPLSSPSYSPSRMEENERDQTGNPRGIPGQDTPATGELEPSPAPAQASSHEVLASWGSEDPVHTNTAGQPLLRRLPPELDINIARHADPATRGNLRLVDSNFRNAVNSTMQGYVLRSPKDMDDIAKSPGEGLMPFKESTAAKSVTLEGGQFTNDDVAKFLEHLPRGVKELTFKDCTQLTPAALAKLPPHIESLTINVDLFSSADSLTTLEGADLSHLKSLSLTGNFTDEMFNNTNLDNLKSLSIHAPEFTGEPLARMNLKNLRSLELASHRIANQALAGNLDSLESLSITGQVDNQGLDKTWKNLKSLWLIGTHCNVDLFQDREKWPNLKSLSGWGDRSTNPASQGWRNRLASWGVSVNFDELDPIDI